MPNFKKSKIFIFPGDPIFKCNSHRPLLDCRIMLTPGTQSRMGTPYLGGGSNAYIIPYLGENPEKEGM